MKPITIGKSITDRQDASLSMYFKDVSKQSTLDINEEIKLAREVQQGNQDSLNKLVKANLRFAISVAKQYQGKGIPLVDLIQEANLGLLYAARLYDPDRGFKFISYAVWWIRQFIIKALSNNSRTVRIPANQTTNIYKIAQVCDKFELENNRKPSYDEICKESNLSPSKVDSALNTISSSISLEAPFSDDEEVGCLLDIIPNSDKTDENIVKSSLSNAIEFILKKLSNREGDVLRMSFGLGMSPMTYEEIAVRFGIGSERVRQIQNEALAKIKMKYGNTLMNLL